MKQNKNVAPEKDNMASSLNRPEDASSRHFFMVITCTSNFLISVQCVALRNLDLLIKLIGA